MSTDVDLYNLSPTAHLLIVGALIASMPLAWVWWRSRHVRAGAHASEAKRQRYGLLVTVTLFLTFDLILFGAFTRLTDSGLGCPDWPGCYGAATPLGAAAQIDAAQTAMPTGPVTTGKAWIEMVHRYLASGVGGLILVMCLMAWRTRSRGNTGTTESEAVAGVSPWVATFTLFWVCVQGAFGALTVTMKLFPAIVTLHLLGAMVLLALLRVQQIQVQPVKAQPAGQLSMGLWVFLVAVFVLVWVQMGLGAWVSTNYAVLACQDFPTCQGSWWPAMNFAQGFEWWRPLGLRSDGQPIAFEALTAIHYVHRLLAYVVLAGLAWAGWRLRQTQGWHMTGSLLWLAGGWQLLTGVSNVVLGWPLAAAVSHTGGAAVTVLLLTGAILRARRNRYVIPSKVPLS